MDDLNDVFRALAHPARQQVVEYLIWRETQPGGPVESGELAELLWDLYRLVWPSVSKHLGVLLAAGLVESQVDGPSRLYTVRRDGFLELAGGAAHVMG